MRNESKILETGNRDMEERLREIKELFEREQGKGPSQKQKPFQKFTFFFIILKKFYVIEISIEFS